MIKLNAKQLRKSQKSIRQLADKIQKYKLKVKRNDIYLILDNVLDTYNIGSIFRLADAIACKKVFLCGGTATPPNPRIKKASINTTEVVEWEYVLTAVEAIGKITSEVEEKLHLGGVKPGAKPVQVVAIEQSSKAIPYDKYEYKLPIALVVGNETYGVSKEVLKRADGIVEIPMFGINKSLNVMVSLAIVVYKVIEKVSEKFDKA